MLNELHLWLSEFCSRSGQEKSVPKIDSFSSHQKANKIALFKLFQSKFELFEISLQYHFRNSTSEYIGGIINSFSSHRESDKIASIKCLHLIKYFTFSIFHLNQILHFVQRSYNQHFISSWKSDKNYPYQMTSLCYCDNLIYFKI